jgi:hypothetical protein
MPRVTRGLVDILTYHILNRGNRGQEFFNRDQGHRVLSQNKIIHFSGLKNR